MRSDLVRWQRPCRPLRRCLTQRRTGHLVGRGTVLDRPSHPPRVTLPPQSLPSTAFGTTFLSAFSWSIPVTPSIQSTSFPLPPNHASPAPCGAHLLRQRVSSEADRPLDLQTTCSRPNSKQTRGPPVLTAAQPQPVEFVSTTVCSVGLRCLCWVFPFLPIALDCSWPFVFIRPADAELIFKTRRRGLSRAIRRRVPPPAGPYPLWCARQQSLQVQVVFG